MSHVRDILIVPTDPAPNESPEWETHPPVAWDGVPGEVGDGITIERIDQDEAEAVLDASEPAGEHFTAHRQWGQFYSFVREIGAVEYEGTHYNWDAPGDLSTTIALSRLIVDNAYCYEYAGRIVRSEERRQIFPISSLEQRLAYRLRDTRFWLTEGEVGQLAQLRMAYKAAAPLEGRVGRALWRAE